MKILIIDNYDSFTYNLYQLVGEILQDTGRGFVLEVKRNDEITAQEIKSSRYDKIIISPGPGNPKDIRYFGVCRDVILDIAKTTPVLGVCLGMQGIAHYYGGKVIKAKQPMHGKTSIIKHDAVGLFDGVPQRINVMRYHSLVAEKSSLPKTLEVTAETVSGSQKEIMGLKHKTYPLVGVQFHPESYATEYGKQILKNFLMDKSLNLTKPLSFGQAYNLQASILNNQCKTDDIIGIFTALDKRNIEPQELLGFYQASKDFMQRLPGYTKNLLDTCGTGGDGLQTFNISTIAALVCASLGVKVAKHGNRASTSKCGSADVLEALGVNINLNSDQAKACLDKCGITFMFAPLYHPAFKFAKEARLRYGKRTYFNLLGPLLNPAEAGFRLIGVSDESKIPLVIEVLKQSDIRKAVIVHSKDGMDEISPAAKTIVYEVPKHGKVRQYDLNPGQFGFKGFTTKELQIDNLEQGKEVFMRVLEARGTAAQMAAVILNSAAALFAADAVESIEQGIKQAYNALHSGKALAKFKEFKEASQEAGLL
ncbi:MAG TPA: anthranilate phosphoribosyltransferase [Candidatus Limnocylindria bacterium]|nr:anthranilate phosphoribosyltransferase [Candidatus Limnocylindria bacterium]